MANPWDSDPVVGRAADSTLIYGAPPKVDPYRVAADRRAEEAAARADRAEGRASGPSLPAGYRWKDGIVGGTMEPIPGGPADKQATVKSKPVPQGSGEKLESSIGIYGTLKSSLDSFQDDYAGNMLGGIENKLQGVAGSFGTPGQRNWWARFQAMDNAVRNDLFGATLTPSEQQSYLATTVSPGLAPSVLKENLAARAEILRKAIARKSEFLKANRFEPEAVDALLGEYRSEIYSPESPFGKADEKPAERRASGQIARTDQMATEDDEIPTRKMTLEQVAAYNALVSAGATADQIRAFGENIGVRIENADKIAGKPFGERSRAENAEYNVPEETAQIARRLGPAGLDEVVAQGMTFGLGDEAAGIGNAAANIVSAPFTAKDFNPVGAYQAGKGAQQLRLRDARGRLGPGGAAAEIGGMFLSGNPAGAMARIPTLAGRVQQGVGMGAGQGALAGFGYGEGAEGSALAALGGGIVGAGAGAALPVGITFAGDRIAGMRNLIGRPGDIAARNLRNALDADGLTPAQAGAGMDAARANGVPGMLADQGENLRNLLGSVTRQPGASRRIGTEVLRQRQLEQGERIEAAIARDLGPISDPNRVAADLAEQARVSAAPLYDAFRAAPGASSVRLDDLMARPSFREGLKKASELAAERGDDPRSLGFDLDQSGEVVLTQTPSWQTLDYIKQGMDDVVYANKNQLTGAPQRNNKTSSVGNTRRMLVARMDAINPTYREARAAYAGPVRAQESLEKGRKALGKNADDINAQVERLSPFEMEQYQLGLRAAMADMVASRSDTGDKVGALLGTRKKRAALARVFGGRPEFDRFIQTLEMEGTAQVTYNRAMTGSPTALNQAADALTGDAGLAETAIGEVIRGGRGGTVWGSIVALLDRARQAEQLGAGRAGEDARESLATLLTQVDPAELATVLAEVNRGLGRLQRGQARQSAIGSRGAARTGSLSGSALGSMQQPMLETR